MNNNNQRIAAFGYWAGYSGAALGVMAWLNQQAKITPPLADISSYASQQVLLKELSNSLAKSSKKPKVLVIGAKGRSGSGAVALAKELGLETVDWDIEETGILNACHTNACHTNEAGGSREYVKCLKLYYYLLFCKSVQEIL